MAGDHASGADRRVMSDRDRGEDRGIRTDQHSITDARIPQHDRARCEVAILPGTGVVFENGRGIDDRARADHRPGIHDGAGADEDAFADGRGWRYDGRRVNNAGGMREVGAEPSASDPCITDGGMNSSATGE